MVISYQKRGFGPTPPSLSQLRRLALLRPAAASARLGGRFLGRGSSSSSSFCLVLVAGRSESHGFLCFGLLLRCTRWLACIVHACVFLMFVRVSKSSACILFVTFGNVLSSKFNPLKSRRLVFMGLVFAVRNVVFHFETFNGSPLEPVNKLILLKQPRFETPSWSELQRNMFVERQENVEQQYKIIHLQPNRLECREKTLSRPQVDHSKTNIKPPL